MYEYNMKILNSLANQVYAQNSVGEVPSFPEVITVAVSNSCNYKCIMCSEWRKPSRSHLSKEIIDKIAPVLQFVQTVYITGGEPLLYPHLTYLFDVSRQSNCNIQMVTNGALFTEESIKLIFEYKLQKLKFSLDSATQETYGYIRGGELNKVLKNLSRITETKRVYGLKAPLIEVGFVAMKKNIGELSKFIVLAKELGVDVIYVSYMAVRHEEVFEQSLFFDQQYSDEHMVKAAKVARAVGIQLNLPPLFSAEAAKQADEYGRRPQTICIEPWRNMFLWPEGGVSMCCGGGGDTGNLTAMSFHEMWNHKSRVAARKLVNTSCPPAACRNCHTVKQQPNAIGTHFGTKEFQNRARHILQITDKSAFSLSSSTGGEQ